MKCPKCGYNSFDHLESCKKCGVDMIAHRTRFGLRSLFFGGPACEPVAPLTQMEEAESESQDEGAAIPAAPKEPTDSGFDFMGEEASDEGSLESSLDELLDPGPEENAQGISVEQQESYTDDLVGEYDESLAGEDSGFDFMLEEEPLTGDREFSGTEAISATEAFPGFAEHEAFEPDSSGDTDPIEASAEPSDQDSGCTSERSHEEIPEFAFEEEPDEVQGELPHMLEEETRGQGSALLGQPPMGEGSGGPTGGAGEPSILSKSLPAVEPFSWGDSSEEPSEDWNSKFGSSEPNLAELFLESLDDTADVFESTEAASAFFADEDLFGKISSDVTPVEPGLQECPEDLEETEAEKSSVPIPPPLTSRIGAGITDLIILAMVFILFLAAGEVASGSRQSDGLFPSPTNLLDLAIPYFLVLFAVCFGYFTLFHFLIGQTPGKMVFRLRVVGEEGGGLMFSQAFLRSVGGLLSLLPAGLGYLRIALDGERRGWNDRLANSRVIAAVGWESLEELSEEGLAEEGS